MGNWNSRRENAVVESVHYMYDVEQIVPMKDTENYMLIPTQHPDTDHYRREFVRQVLREVMYTLNEELRDNMDADVVDDALKELLYARGNTFPRGDVYTNIPQLPWQTAYDLLQFHTRPVFSSGNFSDRGITLSQIRRAFDDQLFMQIEDIRTPPFTVRSVGDERYNHVYQTTIKFRSVYATLVGVTARLTDGTVIWLHNTKSWAHLV